MYLGKSTYKVSDFTEVLPSSLLAQAKDLIHHSAIKHTSSTDSHRIQGDGFRADLKLKNSMLSKWTCTCKAFRKKNICPHIAAAALLLKNMERKERKKTTKNRVSTRRAIQRLDQSELQLLIYRRSQRDPQLADIIRIYGLYKGEDLATETQLEDFLQAELSLAKLGKSKRKLQKQLQSTSLLLDFYRSFSNDLALSRQWILLFALLRFGYAIHRQLDHKTSRKLNQDLHQIALAFPAQSMAPQLKTKIKKDLTQLAGALNYHYTGRDNLYEYLFSIGQDVKPLCIKLIEYTKQRPVSLAHWDLIFQGLKASEAPELIDEYDLENKFPFSSLVQHYSEENSSGNLISLLDWSAGDYRFNDLLRSAIIQKFSVLAQHKEVRKRLLKIEWIQDILSAEESDSTGSHQAENADLQLQTVLWNIEKKYDRLAQKIDETDELDILFYIQKESWNVSKIQDASRALLKRYLDSHLGISPVHKVKKLFQHLFSMDLSHLSRDWREMVHSDYPDRFSTTIL